jgi:hypothetical protein
LTYPSESERSSTRQARPFELIEELLRIALLPMAARSEVRATKVETLEDKDFAALEEEDDSSAEELHALIEREKNDFISLDEYLKRRLLTENSA